MEHNHDRNSMKVQPNIECFLLHKAKLKIFWKPNYKSTTVTDQLVLVVIGKKNHHIDCQEENGIKMKDIQLLYVNSAFTC